jgi:hypothetical protein
MHVWFGTWWFNKFWAPPISCVSCIHIHVIWDSRRVCMQNYISEWWCSNTFSVNIALTSRWIEQDLTGGCGYDTWKNFFKCSCFVPEQTYTGLRWFGDCKENDSQRSQLSVKRIKQWSFPNGSLDEPEIMPELKLSIYADTKTRACFKLVVEVVTFEAASLQHHGRGTTRHGACYVRNKQ